MYQMQMHPAPNAHALAIFGSKFGGEVIADALMLMADGALRATLGAIAVQVRLLRGLASALWSAGITREIAVVAGAKRAEGGRRHSDGWQLRRACVCSSSFLLALFCSFRV